MAPTIYCLNKSPRSLAEELEKCLTDKPKVVRRPYNHYKPTLTDWWIVPAVELPFFKFPKYYFFWDENKRDIIGCGYFVTKGMDPLLKSVFTSAKGKRLLMNDSWGWQKFIAARRNGTLQEKIKSAAASHGAPIEIIFHGGYIDDPGIFDPQAAYARRDRYVFGYDPASDTVRIKGAKRDATCLKFLNKIRDWQSFDTAMQELESNQFLWCDVIVSAPFAVREYGEFAPDEDVRDATAINDRFLHYFADMVF